MKRVANHRDITSPGASTHGFEDTVADGRNVIAVIGIDRYRAWNRLRNAVADAHGVLATFQDLGFEPVIEPLLDEAATGTAIRRLAADDLRPRLQPDDSLVVFFAGHGYTAVSEFADGGSVKTGYLIPVDADRDDAHRSTWLRLEIWLGDIARLPARHILVILDACHSGIALDCDTRSRGQGVRNAGVLDPLRARRSRRVITSALDNERAMDSGPIAGHSLFTGYLIEALRGGMFAWTGDSLVTGSEIGHYVRRRVRESTCEQQTPDIGTLELDDRGELLVSLPRPQHAVAPSTDSTLRGSRVVFGTRHGPLRAPGPAPVPRRYGDADAHRTESWTLDAAYVAQLDRHAAERMHGEQVLSIVGGEAMAARTAWATWAAGHGYLTLMTQAQDLRATIADLLGQTPWLRCLPEARRRVAAAARIDVAAVDATLDAQSAVERRRWIADLALDQHVQVSGWLLCALRGMSAGTPDLTSAPVKDGELLAITCDLACPTAVLVQHPSPTTASLERAIAIAAALTGYMPSHAVAVTAPEALLDRVLRGAPDSAALSMARQGRVRMATPAHRSPGRARARTAQVLFEALARDPRTFGRFELHGRVASEAGPAIDADLVAPGARIAVVIDGWYYFHDPEGYRRDRIQDVRLQRAGYFVMRFLTEDIDDPVAGAVRGLPAGRT